MKVKVEHEYSHSLARVHEAFSDPDFYVRKFEGVGDRNVHILDSSDDEDGFWIEIEREIRTDAPAVLRGIVGEWNSLRQTEHWHDDDGGYANDLELFSDLVPIRIRGRMFLSGDDGACVNRIEMDVSSSMPLLGRQLERFGAASTRRSLTGEYEFIRNYLAANPATAVKKKAKKKIG